MTYRVALTYHPDVGTFRGKRGAWRVYCWDDEYHELGEEVLKSNADGTDILDMPAGRRYRPGTWVNPLKILKEYQSTKRSNTQ